MARNTSTGFVKGVNQGLRVEIETPGLDEAIERLQRYAAIGDTDAKRVRAGMNQTVKLVLGQANQTVPYRTGKLKGTLFSKVKVYGEGNVTGQVGSNMAHIIPYTLEGGRKPNRRGRMAIAPRRWLYHAYSREKNEVDVIWKNTLELIMKDLAGK